METKRKSAKVMLDGQCVDFDAAVELMDGDYLPRERGDKLTEIAKSFGSIHPYIGDNGLIYL